MRFYSLIISLCLMYYCCLPQSVAQRAETDYYIQSQIGGKYLDVKGGSRNDGTPLHLWQQNRDFAQVFRLEDAGGGYFYIRSALGKYVRVNQDSRAERALVSIAPRENKDSFKWKFKSAGGGYHHIQSKLGLYLDVQWANPANGTPIWMWQFNGGTAQKWKLHTITPPSKNVEYVLKSAVGDKYLDVQWGNSANGTELHLWPLNRGVAQVFTLEDAGGGYVYIRSKLGKYVHVNAGSRAQQAKVSIWQRGSTDAFKWKLRAAGLDYFFIQSKLGTYLDVKGGVSADGTPIWMWNFNAGKAQKWKFERVGSGNSAPRLTGFVDMHTHPMSHLAFGGKVMHGAPDIDILVPAIPSGNGCRHYQRARTIEEALASCRATHGGFGAFDNTCGDDKRKLVLRGVEGGMGSAINHHEEGARGYPHLNAWPEHNNLTHQQMWIDWVKRAHDGGLNTIVALAVNNVTYSTAFSGPGDRNPDDVSSANIQIAEMKRMIARHNWLEIAYSSQDMRRIVRGGKLAVILGIEVDNIGNFHKDNSINPNAPSNAAKDKVRRELVNLHRQGIRYIFPLHVVDNKFGGTAIYENIFNLSNYHQTGQFWDVACAPSTSNIDYQFEVAGFDPEIAFIKGLLGLDVFRNPPTPPNCRHGHRNNLGITPLGDFAIKEMMKMGMMIDIDHMSEKAVEATLAIAEHPTYQYPLNAGHNNLRSREAEGKERLFTAQQFRRIGNLGGMVGVGTANAEAGVYVRNWRAMNSVLNGKNIAIGTDANGMEPLPPPPSAAHRINSSPYRFGQAEWSYDRDGMAHYGLLPEFIQSLRLSNAERTTLFSSAEYFVQMWEKCEARSRALR